MNYLEATETLMGFKYVTRENKQWSDSKSYLVYVPGVTHFLKLTMLPTPPSPVAELKPWAATVEDSTATDWCVVEPESLLRTPESVLEPVVEEVAA